MCYQHDSFLKQPRLRKQTSSNIPARALQQDMLNRKKNISVTGMVFPLIRFSGSAQINTLFPVHKVEGFQWEPPLSWIKAPKLYVRLDHGEPPSSFRTKETDFKASDWTDANQFTLWVATSNIHLHPKCRSTATVSARMKTYSFPFAAEHFWDSVL